MSLPTAGWKNKGGTSVRKCKCGSWKDHWLRLAKKSWPTGCSVVNCSGSAELGAHVVNPKSDKEWIVPFCKTCNGKATDETFTLINGITLVPANQAETCAK